MLAILPELKERKVPRNVGVRRASGGKSHQKSKSPKQSHQNHENKTGAPVKIWARYVVNQLPLDKKWCQVVLKCS